MLPIWFLRTTYVQAVHAPLEVRVPQVGNPWIRAFHLLSFEILNQILENNIKNNTFLYGIHRPGNLELQ